MGMARGLGIRTPLLFLVIIRIGISPGCTFRREPRFHGRTGSLVAVVIPHVLMGRCPFAMFSLLAGGLLGCVLMRCLVHNYQISYRCTDKKTY